MSPDAIRTFALSKLGWIRHQQLKLRRQEYETPREYRDSESHHVWGKSYQLKLIESCDAPSVDLAHDQMNLRLRPDTHARKRRAIMEEWYREQVKVALPLLIAKWESVMAVKVERFFVRRMKTRWGSCTPRTHRIRLNTELGKKSPEFLEYVVVHEMVHLIERQHNDRFGRLMDRHLPNWRDLRKALNNAPLRIIPRWGSDPANEGIQPMPAVQPSPASIPGGLYRLANGYLSCPDTLPMTNGQPKLRACKYIKEVR